MTGIDSAHRVGALLGNFRLLEAAGACGLIAGCSSEGCRLRRPSQWWADLADSTRTYRAAIHSAALHGRSAIEDWSRSAPPGADADFLEKRNRVGIEYRRWTCEVPGGQAYVAWLGAYVAVAEIDGERARRGLDKCIAIVREFVDVPGLGCELSIYHSVQAGADALRLFLPLPEHPLRDVARFAFLPSPLTTGYGS